MTHGSLFSGIGGFDLAAEWMGWENKFHCEWNTFGQKVLHHYWPQAEQFTDITKTDFTKYANRIDILTGGFPCQPYSSAGKRLGKEDERHLWPEMLRAIREIQPRWVVGENVLGLVNWSDGLVFHEVQADLEAEGYEVQPYVLPAVSVNAPHRRERIFFVAYSNGNGCNQCNSDNEVNTNKGRINALCDIINGSINGNTTNTKHQGLERQHWEWEGCTKHRSDKGIFVGSENKLNTTNTNGIGLRRESDRIGESRFIGKNDKRNDWQNFPTVSPVHYGDDGISDRLDSITFPKWRNESIKAGGNAVCPQVVLQIFKTIEQYERINTPDKNK
jgi:DNA (cytosine-5)-methyltransferase 1